MASDLAREALAPEGVLPLRVNEMTPSVIICAEGSRISIQWREQRPDQPDHDEYGRAEAMAAFLVEAANRHGSAYDAIGSGVKALEWDAFNHAETEIGTYEILVVYDEDGGDDQLCVELDRPSFGISFIPTRDGATFEEAKAAAQADFERRVLACLAPTLSGGAEAGPVGEAVAQALDTIKMVYQDMIVGSSPRDHLEAAYRALAARTVEEPGEVERGSDEESYQIGKRDGYEDAVQHIDERTGGDGEYVAVVGYDGDDRNCPDAPSMVAKIVRRFEATELRAETAEAALAETREALRDLLTKPTDPASFQRARALTGDAQEAGR